MFGYIILVDLPTCKVQVDEQIYEVDSDFQGFHRVPQGQHRIRFIFPDGKEEELEVEVAPGQAVVRSFEDGKWKEVTQEREKYYRQLALSGALDEKLLDFPENLENPDQLASQAAEAITQKWSSAQVRGLDSAETPSVNLHNEKTRTIPKEKDPAQTDALDLQELQSKGDLLYGIKTSYTDMDIVYLEESMEQYLQNPSDQNYHDYLEQLKKNLVLEEQMIIHKGYFEKVAQALSDFLEKRQKLFSNQDSFQEEEKRILSFILDGFKKMESPFINELLPSIERHFSLY
ncbi:MAG: hypothetical protein D6785_12245 [Planctomycetota bacterium]|nr:MAG: hypothetical protein D6785_12245 [Planctomycetota bacterium]